VRSISFRLSIPFLAVITAACTSGGQSQPGEGGAGGQGDPVSSGGTPGSGGMTSSGGAPASGGIIGTGGAEASGGITGTGGTTTSGEGGAGAGGTTATGGKATGGVTSTGGNGSGGQAGGGSGGSGQKGGTTGGQGGVGTGGATIPGSGGMTNLGTGGATGGRTGTGGAATGGTTSTDTSTSTVDCNATMPTGGSDHCGQNTQGSAGGQSWSLWCNSLSSSACITTFSTPAFSARWNNNSDFLARAGLEFGNAGKTWDQYGTLKADFSFTKTGSGGGYSYIGIYGWTTNPCVEWYIVDDKFGTMPFNAYNATQKGTATIDGEVYKLFQNKTSGTGGSRCSGVSQWDQFWSIRQKARQCGTITISEHFKAWEAAGLQMGGLLEAKILVETGGGSGSIDFPVAKVTAQ
jgi:endo-1,4-beta-xylanase